MAALLGSSSVASMAHTGNILHKSKPVVAGKSTVTVTFSTKKTNELYCTLWQTGCGAIGTACGTDSADFISCVLELNAVMCG